MVAHPGKAKAALYRPKWTHAGAKAGPGAIIRFPHLIQHTFAQWPKPAEHHGNAGLLEVATQEVRHRPDEGSGPGMRFGVHGYGPGKMQSFHMITAGRR